MGTPVNRTRPRCIYCGRQLRYYRYPATCRAHAALLKLDPYLTTVRALDYDPSANAVHKSVEGVETG